MDNDITSATTSEATNGHCRSENNSHRSARQSNNIENSSLTSHLSSLKNNSQLSPSLASTYLTSLCSIFYTPQNASKNTLTNDSTKVVSRSASAFSSFCTILSRSKNYLSSLRAGSFSISLIPVLLGALLA